MSITITISRSNVNLQAEAEAHQEEAETSLGQINTTSIPPVSSNAPIGVVLGAAGSLGSALEHIDVFMKVVGAVSEVGHVHFTLYPQLLIHVYLS